MDAVPARPSSATPPMGGAPYAAPGSWPDADMLPSGRVGIRAERGTDRESLLTHSRNNRQVLHDGDPVGRTAVPAHGCLPPRILP